MARSAWVSGDHHVALALVPAARRRHDLREHRRDPALHGLERLAREPLVGLAQAAGRARRSASPRSPGARAAAGACRAPRIAIASVVLDRLDRRRARLPVEHRQLAEDVARPEVRERDRAAVRSAGGPRAPGPSARRNRCRPRRPRGTRPRPPRTGAAPPPARPWSSSSGEAPRRPARGAAARSCPRCSEALSSMDTTRWRARRPGEPRAGQTGVERLLAAPAPERRPRPTTRARRQARPARARRARSAPRRRRPSATRPASCAALRSVNPPPL